MIYRWIGAVMILAGCGGFGFSMVAEHCRQEKILAGFQRAIRSMRWELQYRMTALPELCALGGRQAGGITGQVLCRLGIKLEEQICPDVTSCMQIVLDHTEGLPRFARQLFRQMGGSLGRYDLQGQLEGLEALGEACKLEQQRLNSGRTQRLRSYETLSLCAGAALAILLV